MILTKSCPRCHGDVYQDGDSYRDGDPYMKESRRPSELVCLQCGYRKYLDVDPAYLAVLASRFFPASAEQR